MAPIVYYAKVVSPVRQAVGIIAALGGMLAIIYLGAPFVIDEQGDFRQISTLGLLAVSCVWGLLAVLSQSAGAHWSISSQEVHERKKSFILARWRLLKCLGNFAQRWPSKCVAFQFS